MKITAFNPLVLTPKADDVIALFEALGFERKHLKTGINDEDIDSIDMKHPDGFRVDVARVEKMPQDMTTIRLNVRDFDEAYEFLTAHGFTNTQGDKVTDTGSSKATLMVSSTGYTINLAQHIRKEESGQ